MESESDDELIDYGSHTYWDERYIKISDDESFEWYQSYMSLKPHIKPYMALGGKILHLGCGNSMISAEMYDDGFTDIVNIDISSVLIQKMEERYQDRPMEWKTMDVTKLDFDDGIFDFAFDKGTMDALMCGSNSSSNVERMLSEISRTLKPGGVFIEVSYGNPPTRMDHMDQEEKFNWSIEILKLPKGPLIDENGEEDPEEDGFHYVYVCKKNDSNNNNN